MFCRTEIALSLLSLLLLSPVILSEKCNPQDKKVLLQIKKDFNNLYLLSSWDPKTDCCGWSGIECDEKTNRVITLDISDLSHNSTPSYTNFSGHIPPSVGDLPYLEILTFYKLPYLTGPIHPAIAKLKNLKYIFIQDTNVSGPVPSFLAELKNLQILHLSTNNLSGPIPSSLSQLSKLESLHLDYNKLTGPIPESFGSFNKPGMDIILSDNQLSGPIPASLGQIDPDRIDLSRNKLEGDASMLFGSKKKTQIIDVSRNLLSFDFSKVDFPKESLIWLNINHNKIYGELPVALRNMENLQQFNVSYNRLCGEIPQGGTGRLQDRFDEYSYLHNKCLCGAPLPKCNYASDIWNLLSWK